MDWSSLFKLIILLNSIKKSHAEHCSNFNQYYNKRDNIVSIGTRMDWSSSSSIKSFSNLSRKSHVENCHNFNEYCNNSNDDWRDNIVSIGKRTDWSSLSLSLSLQAHTNLVQFSQEKLLLQLQSIILPRQQQKGQYCFQWNEDGLKLFKLILIFVWTILSRKAHVENCYSFNQHNNNNNKRDTFVSIGMRRDWSSSSSY